jgi:serpin B
MMQSSSETKLGRVGIRIAAIAVMLVLLWQCSDNPVDPKFEPPRELTKSESHLVASGNSFGLKLFRNVVAADPDNNVFISPISAAMALGMTYNGADGATKEAMEATLELSGLSVEEVNDSYRSLINLLVSLDPEVAVEIANSIWYRLGFEVEPDFLDINHTYFDAEVDELDFGSPEAPDRINQWVDDKTHGKIEKIVKTIGPDVVMFLINATYFKGTWTYQFDPADTKDSTFYLADGGTASCRLMTMTKDLLYTHTERFDAVDLPYGHELYRMTVLLPAEGVDINELIAELTNENWETWMAGFATREVQLGLPKFTLEYEQTLNDMLINMGMGIAFTGAADFTKIRRSGGIWISKVKQKTFVRVDEEGTEAAAVTSVTIIESMPRPVSFLANRPFIFAIRENHSGTILFIGKMMAPPANEG